MNKIVNIKSGEKYDEYCGRANKTYNLKESKWANPFIIGKHGDRAEVIKKYEEYIRANPQLLKDLPELEGKVLACWCNVNQGENCHCQVLGKLLEELNKAQIKSPEVIENQEVKENDAQIDFIGNGLLRYNKEQVYCCFDVETTGLSLLHSVPWQLSFALFTIDKIIETQNHYIWWDELQISDDAPRVTNFNYEYYKSQAKPLVEVLPKFERYYLDDKVIKTGHNIIPYDSSIHNVARKSIGLKPIFTPNLHSIDTLALARAYRLGIKPPKFNLKGENYEFLMWSYKMISYHGKKMKTSLGFLIKEFDIPLDETKLHDASYDILKNIEVFKQFLWKMEI